jgi:hypothetical protein
MTRNTARSQLHRIGGLRSTALDSRYKETISKIAKSEVMPSIFNRTADTPAFDICYISGTDYASWISEYCLHILTSPEHLSSLYNQNEDFKIKSSMGTEPRIIDN